MARPQAWPECDDDIKRFVELLIERLQGELGDRLIGVYLHGSLAMGSYYRPKSDMDLIVIVDRELDDITAESTGIAIANTALDRPTVGNVELSVITAVTAKQVPVPTPYEVHYSSEWHDKILNAEVDYRKERTDPDLSSHFMYVTQRGICLFGRPITEMFGQVSWQYFMDAVLDDLDWILEDEHILETPFYSVLNICRVFQLRSEDNQLVHSKDEGGEWGLEQLPQAFRPLIQQALDIYRSPVEVDEALRRTGGVEWEADRLLAFRDYARLIING